MNRTKYTILTYLQSTIILFALMLVHGCSDDPIWSSRGTGEITLQIYSGEATRDDDPDPETLIDRVDIFFYPGGYTDTDNKEVSAACHISQTGCAGDGQFEFKEFVDSETLNKLFPGNSTACPIVVVANHDFENSAKPTLSEIKNTSLTMSDFDTPSNFVMMSESEVTLNSSNSNSIDGTIVLKRVASKITINLKVAKSLINSDVEYRPSGAPTATISGINDTGVIECTSLPTSYTAQASSDHTFSIDAENTESRYYTYTMTMPFYTYPLALAATASLPITVTIPWVASDSNEYAKSFTYNLNFRGDDGEIVSNKNYIVSLTADFLGSSADSDENSISTEFSLSIEDWKKADVKVALSKSKFLVVDRTELSLYGEDSASIAYVSHEKPSAVIDSIAFTSYLLDKNNPQRVLIYKHGTDGESDTYGAEAAFAADHKAYFDKFFGTTSETTKINGIVYSTVGGAVSTNSTSTLEGNVNFTLDNVNIAGKLSRPVNIYITIYTSDGLHQRVVITQYPSKYVEYDIGGYNFVDGYFANAKDYVGNSSALIDLYGAHYGYYWTGYGYYNYFNSTDYGFIHLYEWGEKEYQSDGVSWKYVNAIPTTYSAIDDYNDTYTAYSGKTHTGYYYAPYEASITKVTPSSTTVDLHGYNDLTEENVSYCHYGYLYSDHTKAGVDFDNTFNVRITAFSSSTDDRLVKPYSVNGVEQDSPQWIYTIGDPRRLIKNANDDKLGSTYDGFIADDHNGNTTDSKKLWLYDYLVFCCYQYDWSYGYYDSDGNWTYTYKDKSNRPDDYGWEWYEYSDDYYSYTYYWRYLYYRAVHTWEDTDQIKIGAAGDTRFCIAPYFKCQSTRGANAGDISYVTSLKRGATFQETGYPAGRWRLPTCIELYYMMKLQVDGVITDYFKVDTSYWAGGGYTFKIYSYNGSYYVTIENSASVWSSSTKTASARYIYDLWYWGEDPDPDCFPNGDTTQHPIFYSAKPGNS